MHFEQEAKRFNPNINKNRKKSNGNRKQYDEQECILTPLCMAAHSPRRSAPCWSVPSTWSSTRHSVSERLSGRPTMRRCSEGHVSASLSPTSGRPRSCARFRPPAFGVGFAQKPLLQLPALIDT